MRPSTLPASRLACLAAPALAAPAFAAGTFASLGDRMQAVLGAR